MHHHFCDRPFERTMTRWQDCASTGLLRDAFGGSVTSALEGTLAALDRGLWAAGGPGGTLLSAVGIHTCDAVHCQQVSALGCAYVVFSQRQCLSAVRRAACDLMSCHLPSGVNLLASLPLLPPVYAPFGAQPCRAVSLKAAPRSFESGFR